MAWPHSAALLGSAIALFLTINWELALALESFLSLGFFRGFEAKFPVDRREQCDRTRKDEQGAGDDAGY